MFRGNEFSDGGAHILKGLNEHNIKGNFSSQVSFTEIKIIKILLGT